MNDKSQKRKKSNYIVFEKKLYNTHTHTNGVLVHFCCCSFIPLASSYLLPVKSSRNFRSFYETKEKRIITQTPNKIKCHTENKICWKKGTEKQKKTSSDCVSPNFTNLLLVVGDVIVVVFQCEHLSSEHRNCTRKKAPKKQNKFITKQEITKGMESEWTERKRM